MFYYWEKKNGEEDFLSFRKITDDIFEDEEYELKFESDEYDHEHFIEKCEIKFKFLSSLGLATSLSETSEEEKMLFDKKRRRNKHTKTKCALLELCCC